MFTIQDLVQPDTVEEAYRVLTGSNGTILGGCAFLRLGSQKIGAAIDLSKLHLNYIKEYKDYIVIGAMATFRDIETSPLLSQYFNGVLPKSVGNIIGVQFRSIVTAGATVYSKYGFSDFITALLALDTEVELHNGGRMPLEVFLNKPNAKDILTGIFIKKNDKKAVYQDLRNSSSDYAILNAAVSNMGEKWRIVVGARPQRAQIAAKASEVLSKGNAADNMENAANMAAEELAFGTNLRGSAEYRKAMCRVLVKRAITEVLECR